MKLIILSLIYCFTSIYANSTICSSIISCDECISIPQCAWCGDSKLVAELRCFLPESYRTSCPERYIYNPENTLKILHFGHPPQRDLYSSSISSSSGTSSSFSSSSGFSSSFGSSSSSDNYDRNNYVTPRHIEQEIRINTEQKFQLHYGHMEDFAMDVYFILDLRKSNENKAEQLYNLASKTVDTLRNSTSNFKIGLGYIDSNSGENNGRPSFINYMSLSEQSSLFLNAVTELSSHGAQNASEVYLDPLIISTCTYDIGWRDRAHKILIFATNTDYQHDEQIGRASNQICNLNFKGNGVYSLSSPYPTFSQINNQLGTKQIFVVFAVDANLVDKYKALQTKIVSSAITELNVDTLNISDLIKEHYEKLHTKVELGDTAPNFIEVKYFTKCLDKTGTEKETNLCDFIKTGDEVTYTVTLKVLSCPKDNRDWKQTMYISPRGVNTKLQVDLKLICSCPYLMQQSPNNTNVCSGNGIFENNECKCSDAFYGKHCECAGIVGDIPTTYCRPNDRTLVNCSGRGDCVCGICSCHKRFHTNELITGTYCECDNYTCDRVNGNLCSGSENGECVCGTCQCKNGWNGDACEIQRTEK